MTALRQRMLEDLQIRNYAPTTVACYIRSVAEFAQHFNKPPDQLGPEEIRSWQLFLLNERRVKLSTYIQAVCALRFFYRNTLNRKIEIDRIPLPRYEKKLPVILSKGEVKALLEAPKNLGHRESVQGREKGQCQKGRCYARRQQDSQGSRFAEAAGRSHPQGSDEGDRLATPFRTGLHQRHPWKEDGVDRNIHEG